MIRKDPVLVHDIFNQVYDAWQLVHQKPWTRPPNLNLVVNDLADAIHQGRLFAYTESAALGGVAR